MVYILLYELLFSPKKWVRFDRERGWERKQT